MEQAVEHIQSIIETMAQRYQGKGGDVRFAGIEGGTVKIEPTGFCWR